MLQFDAVVLGNRAIARDFFLLELSWEKVAGIPRPGQFLSLRPGEAKDPLLRRPFAFSGFSEAPDGACRASLIYQLRGPATRLLSAAEPGKKLDVLGPLGHGFPSAADFAAEGSAPLLAAGGVGLGPLLFLAASLEAARPASGLPEAPLLLGFRDSGSLPDIELPPGTVVCTDDGSTGFHGTPSDWLSQNSSGTVQNAKLLQNAPRSATLGAPAPRVCACGPGPMLASLARLVAERGWRGSFSAEAWMACGVGACYGCAVPKADGSGYARVCADGPVFEAEEIKW